MKARTLATTGNKHWDRQLAAIIRDPVKYAKAVLCHDLWATQVAILRAISEHARVAVKACHASSKTFTAAVAVLWWISQYKDGIAITTRPKFEQVEKLLFMEIHKALQTSKIAYPKPNLTELKLDRATTQSGFPPIGRTLPGLSRRPCPVGPRRSPGHPG